jgi:ATP-binding cassette, subfamily C (CFTR/MRP), member 1
LATLFVLHIIYTVFQIQTVSLQTRLSTASGVVSIIAIFAALVLSFIEDQRSVDPSDLLVIYFSFSSLLYIPRLRSLWLILPASTCRTVWTILYVFTLLALFLECAVKTKLLRPAYQNLTKEQLIGFWGRSFYVWVLPIFQLGYSNVMTIDDTLEVDKDLRGYSAGRRLQASWRRMKSPHRLLKATLQSNMWPLVTAIVPRLCLSAFTFCQPFLINSTVTYISNTDTSPESKLYGPALVGAYALVYMGRTVRLPTGFEFQPFPVLTF